MDAGLLAQYAVIALAVLLSAIFVLRRQFPGAMRRLRSWLAIVLLRGQAGWRQRLGRALAPPAKSAGSDGCGACNGCDP